MTRYLGKDPDYKAYYAKNLLKDAWDVKPL
jgi:hypothetical protein